MSWDEWLAATSWLRRLDVRVKAAWLLLATVLAFLWEEPVLLAGLLAVVLAVALSAGLSRRFLLRLVILLAPLALLSLGTQALFGEALLVRKVGHPLQALFFVPDGLPWLGGRPVWREGMRYGLAIGLKTMTMALAAPLLFLSSEMDEMLASLSAMGVPYRLAFVFASAVRFFPLLFEEAQSIIEAQRTRGLAPEELGVRGKLAFYGRIAVPLVLGAMLRAQRMEVALQTKGFPPAGPRTALHAVHRRRGERAAVAAALFLTLAAVAARFGLGVGRF